MEEEPGLGVEQANVDDLLGDNQGEDGNDVINEGIKHYI